MRVSGRLLVVLSAAMLAAGCTSSRAVPSAGMFRANLLTQVVSFGDGQVTARPYRGPLPSPVETVAGEFLTVESADPLLWRNTGLGPSDIASIAAYSGYGLVTVSPRLLPRGALGNDSFAWLVFYQVHLRTSVSCATVGSRDAALMHGGWRVYVYPELRPGVNSGYVGYPYLYTPATTACGLAIPAAANIVWPHVSIPWHLISRQGTRITIGYLPSCDQRVRFFGPRPDPERPGAVVLQLIVAVDRSSCPFIPTEYSVLTLPTRTTPLLHGPVGVVPIPEIPVSSG